MSDTVALLWDNFGPLHADRAVAVAARLGPGRTVVGIELSPRSDDYGWAPPTCASFAKLTLFATAAAARHASTGRLALLIVRAIRAARADTVFVCSYQRPGVLLATHLLRWSGRRVFAMGCSKFDDVPRRLGREWLKRLALRSFSGAIGSGVRSRDYFRWLGLPADRIAGGYNSLSIDRIRAEAQTMPAPAGVPFAERHFTIVARFVAKKDLLTALDAYARYRLLAIAPRPLHLLGDGPLEAELRAHVAILGLGEHVRFQGFVQSDAVARALGSSLALILPSREEQFGNAVIEAQAMGVPAILTHRCGAADLLIRSHVNGFVVRPGDVEGIARFMVELECEPRWRAMAAASAERAWLNDASHFADAVLTLLGGGASGREPVRASATRSVA